MGRNAAGEPAIQFSNAELRFTHIHDGRGEGLSVIDIAVPDPVKASARAEKAGGRASLTGAIEIAGVWIRFQDLNDENPVGVRPVAKL